MVHLCMILQCMLLLILSTSTFTSRIDHTRIGNVNSEGKSNSNSDSGSLLLSITLETNTNPSHSVFGHGIASQRSSFGAQELSASTIEEITRNCTCCKTNAECWCTYTTVIFYAFTLTAWATRGFCGGCADYTHTEQQNCQAVFRFDFTYSLLLY